MSTEGVTPEALGEVLSAIANRSQVELLGLTAEQLKNQWSFRWEPDAPVEWNLYKFNDALAMHKRRCRVWEEHHNGSCCVVERVRDQYLMPRIREIMPMLQVSTSEDRNCDSGTAGLSVLADKVVISNATGNETLFLGAVQNLIAAIRKQNS